MSPASALLSWYRRHRRDLPWRASEDPYGIWLSEVMLQQTRVETVLPYYRRFLELFPTVEALAAAPIEEVLAAWSGLGYYRRARFLHRAAAEIVALGGFPRTVEALRRLPGVGDYTAAAVASIAFGVVEPVSMATWTGYGAVAGARGGPEERPDAVPSARRRASCWIAITPATPTRP
ncbi:MAG: hypothetical protein U0R26_11285 [Solirubrobacterales bacterium]